MALEEGGLGLTSPQMWIHTQTLIPVLTAMDRKTNVGKCIRNMICQDIPGAQGHLATRIRTALSYLDCEDALRLAPAELAYKTVLDRSKQIAINNLMEMEPVYKDVDFRKSALPIWLFANTQIQMPQHEGGC